MGSVITVESSPGHDIGVVSLTGELVKIQMKKKNVSEDNPLKIYRLANQKDIEIVKKIYDARRENRIYLGNSELKIFLMAAGVLAFSGYVGYSGE